MERRKNTFVSVEEMNRQREFIYLVKELNRGRIKKFQLNTYGCQMNENDSERLSGMLNQMGYVETEDIEESDLIIYNTCCVRENAELKVYGHLGALKKLKREKPDMIIAVCGCMMQQKEVVDHIRDKYSHVDLIFGTHNLYKFPELLYSSLSSGQSIVDIWDSDGSIAEDVPIERKDRVKAWVTIMYGCNNFCSYCIVPYVRGRERSRQPERILEEISELGREGYREITLLGQNVNSYGKDLDTGVSFSDLLRRVNEIDGIERIRFMTSHPKDLSDDLIAAVRDCDKVCEHFHLPVQSGSSRILKEMNRKYTKEQYLELVDKIKSSINGVSLTTDIIVGYPGETEEDFEDTLDVVKRVRYDMAYTFLYSKRTGTPAANKEEQVPEEVKKERFERLLEIQNKISKENNEKLLNAEVEVLVEGVSKTNKDVLSGRTRTNKIVNFKGNEELIGKLVKVKINKVQTWSLEGTLV